MEITVRSTYDAYQNIHDLYVREGDREITVMASMEKGLIEFCYYNIKEWRYCSDPFTEEDRARLVARIIDHYTAQGWRVEVDRRRFCPRCFTRVDGSDRSDWPGGECNFCGKDLDRFFH